MKSFVLASLLALSAAAALTAASAPADAGWHRVCWKNPSTGNWWCGWQP